MDDHPGWARLAPADLTPARRVIGRITGGPCPRCELLAARSSGVTGFIIRGRLTMASGPRRNGSNPLADSVNQWSRERYRALAAVRLGHGEGQSAAALTLQGPSHMK